MSGRDRRDLDRRGHDRDDYTRKHPSSSSSSAAAARPQLNEYWIAGEGINRQVLQTEICKYLGAEATCRPGEYQGVPGFKIKALRPFTPDMLDDLRNASKAFSNENRAYVKRHDRELAYHDSQTYEQTNPQPDYDRSFPGRDSPAYTTASASYPVSSASGFPSSSAGFAPSSSFVTHPGSHPGLPINSAPPVGYGSHDHYGHPPSSRDSRDTMMRDAPSYMNHPQGGHPSAGFHSSGPSYNNDPYASSRGDPRGDTQMYDSGYANGAYGAPSRRQEPVFRDSMPEMNGGYPASAAGRNGMPYGATSGGYDPYARGPPVDQRYGRR